MLFRFETNDDPIKKLLELRENFNEAIILKYTNDFEQDLETIITANYSNENQIYKYLKECYSENIERRAHHNFFAYMIDILKLHVVNVEVSIQKDFIYIHFDENIIKTLFSDFTYESVEHVDETMIFLKEKTSININNLRKGIYDKLSLKIENNPLFKQYKPVDIITNKNNVLLGENHVAS